ncbi:MAG: hypothetical protein Q8Q49_03705 [bacterium]|nr:hypothetical protein [bacterium]
MAKKKQNKLTKWIVLFLAVIAVFAVYSFSKNNVPQSSTGYLVYQDPTYDFTIEYPQAWKIRKDTQVFENGDAIAFRISGPTQKKYTELTDSAQLAVSKPIAIDTDLATWMKSYFSPQAKFSKLPLSNYNFEAVEDCGYMMCMRYYFIEIGSQIYGVALYADGTSAEKASRENSLLYMLKSLRFNRAADGMISREDAVTKVKVLPEVIDYLKRVPSGLVAVNGEEDNSYLVQVYEFKNGHTATFNWYKVDKTTGTVTKEFDN